MSPGVRFRLVESDGSWCDAQQSAAWTRGSAVEQASAYAQRAAAPWFDGVTIRAASEVSPGVVALTTHALTNGIVADWTILVDGRGIREATWIAREFGVAPLEGETEGLTALPGATKTFVRASDGSISATTPIVPTHQDAVGVTAIDTMSDGFRIQFHYGATAVYPGLEGTTMATIRAVTRENYEEFLTWGLHKGWSSNTGHVYVDGESGLTCIACVFIGQSFNIHIASQVLPLVGVVAGVSYPDDRAALSTIIGHEMFHNFQNAYSGAVVGATMIGAYTEGIARAQETFHGYSGVSHQPESLTYAGNANGCNFELAPEPHAFEFPEASPIQWVATPTLSDGPSTGQSYSACDFWLTYHGNHGRAGLLDLLEASAEHRMRSGWDEMKRVIETARGAPIDDELAGFAAAILTGERLSWRAADGSGPSRDWGVHLGRWTPEAMAPGGSTTTLLRDGGMMGARVTENGAVTTDPVADVALYVIGDDASVVRVPNGATVDAPAWVVAIRPGVGSANVTLAYG